MGGLLLLLGNELLLFVGTTFNAAASSSFRKARAASSSCFKANAASEVACILSAIPIVKEETELVFGTIITSRFSPLTVSANCNSLILAGSNFIGRLIGRFIRIGGG